MLRSVISELCGRSDGVDFTRLFRRRVAKVARAKTATCRGERSPSGRFHYQQLAKMTIFSCFFFFFFFNETLMGISVTNHLNRFWILRARTLWWSVDPTVSVSRRLIISYAEEHVLVHSVLANTNDLWSKLSNPTDACLHDRCELNEV